MAVRPDPFGHHDDLDPEQVAELDLVVPDDPRELTQPPLPRRAEPQGQPAPASRRPVPEPSDHPYPRPFAFPIPRQRRLALTAAVVMAAVLVTAVSGLVGTLVFPGRGPVAAPAALASPTAPPGQVGGLLVDTPLQGLGELSSLTLRPAVLALVPPACDGCATTLVNLQRQTQSAGIRLVVVGRTGQEATLVDLTSVLQGPGSSALVDPGGVLISTYGSNVFTDDLTLLLVRQDGVVTAVVPNPSFDLPSAVDLGTLSEPVASAGLGA
jgi:hypothetical protein